MGVYTFARRAARGACVAAAVLVAAAAAPCAAGAYSTGPSCGERVITSPSGVGFRILFAKNGSVQRYLVVAMADNTELVNEARIALENTYGPAAVDAPPLRIVAFKPGPAPGMTIPAKAIDSCGRTLSFN